METEKAKEMNPKEKAMEAALEKLKGKVWEEMGHCLAYTVSSNHCQIHKSNLLHNRMGQRSLVLHTEHGPCHKIPKQTS